MLPSLKDWQLIGKSADDFSSNFADPAEFTKLGAVSPVEVRSLMFNGSMVSNFFYIVNFMDCI